MMGSLFDASLALEFYGFGGPDAAEGVACPKCAHAFALSEGILECVELKSGRRRWKSGRYGHGQILGVGDLLLVLSEEGELHLVELNAKRFTHLGSIQALSGKTWNNLCLYGKRLLVRNGEEAACIELP